MRTLLGAALAVVLAAPGALAQDSTLAGSLWTCTRARDGSLFVMSFYRGGGVGGGEFQDGEVSPYVFDASKTKKGSWPGRWEQKGQSFTWDFPDQHMRVTGEIDASGTRAKHLTGNEISLELTSAIECSRLPKLPKIGEGLVIPQDGHFMDLDGGEGKLKVPAGVSLPQTDAKP